MAMIIAEKMNTVTDGPFANFKFNEDKMKELRIASWLHDVAKITTP